MQYQEFYQELNKGDLIAIAYNNRMYRAIFLSYGKRGNLRFFLLSRGKYYVDNMATRPKNIYLDFINTNPNQRVIKITEDALSFKDKLDYSNSLDVLKYYNKL